MKLIATQPFGDYAQGAEITDANEISTILAGEQAAFVVKVAGDPVTAGTASASPKAGASDSNAS